MQRPGNAGSWMSQPQALTRLASVTADQLKENVMSPDLRTHLEALATWHARRAVWATDTQAGREVKSFHECAATDIRAAITACEDAERNAVVREKRLADRRFEKDASTPSAFGQLGSL